MTLARVIHIANATAFAITLAVFLVVVAEATPASRDMIRALSYACGYRAAQEQILGELDPAHKKIPEAIYCAAERANAKAHGFDQP